MKKHRAWSVYIFGGWIAVTAAGAERAAVLEELQVTERGPHHRKVVHVTSTFSSDGQTVLRTNQYTELATGMHYWKTGEWLESKEVIDVVPGGGLASQGPHQVGFAANINTLGSINFLSSDGKRLRSHVLGLAYTDAASGQSVLIAQIKDSIGELVGQNQIYYRDAFTDLKADVRYVYTRASLEQDIVLRDVPPDPQLYGLNPETTRLEVFTEFIEAPAPQITQTILRRTGDPAERGAMVLPDFADQTLDFGAMRMSAGEAFPIGSTEDRLNYGVPTGKTWELREGRQFLIEAVRYPAIQAQLDALVARGAVQQAKLNRKPGAGRVFPPTPLQAKAATPEMKTAALALKQDGFVIDFVITSGLTNLTLAADTTYYVPSGILSLWGTTVIEGGTVVKLTNGLFPWLKFENAIDCRTAPYRPAIFTSMHDNTVGETIANSVGNPTNYCGIMYLGPSSNGTFNLHDIHISHLNRGLSGPASGTVNLTNCQVRHVASAFYNNSGFWNLRNILISDAIYAFNGFAPLTNNAEHITFFAVSNFLADVSLPSVNLTNSLLISVTNGFSSWSGTCVSTNPSGTGVFQTIGSGAFYLAINSPYRDAGTTNLDSVLLAVLRTRTTYPPVKLSNTVASDLMLGPIGIGDVDIPDLGYHYDILDYFTSGLIITNCSLALTSGVAIALDYSSTNWGFILKNAKVLSTGGPTNLNRIVRAHMVQEQSTGNPTGRALFYDGASPTTSNELRIRFTHFSQAADDGNLLSTGTNFTALEWSHSLIQNAVTIAKLDGTNTITCGLTNTVWERGSNQFGLAASSASSIVHARNNLFKNSQQHFLGGNSGWSVCDNLIDGGGLNDHGTAITNRNNAYYQATTNLSGGTSNLTLGTLTYVIGPLSSYYQPTNSSLINTGSISAASVSLYHFTTTTNQVKETNSVVDVGPHWVTIDASGNLADGDGDFIPDYLEDTNGNGSYDAGGVETDWQTYSSRNGLTNSPSLKVFTPLR